MKKYIALAVPLAALIVGCNGGSSSSTPPVYLAPGDYTLTLTALCLGESVAETGMVPMIVDTNGNLCSADDNTECAPLNLSANPCYSLSETESGFTTTIQFSSCIATESNTVVNGNLNVYTSELGNVCSGTFNLIESQ